MGQDKRDKISALESWLAKTSSRIVPLETQEHLSDIISAHQSMQEADLLRVPPPNAIPEAPADCLRETFALSVVMLMLRTLLQTYARALPFRMMLKYLGRVPSGMVTQVTALVLWLLSLSDDVTLTDAQRQAALATVLLLPKLLATRCKQGKARPYQRTHHVRDQLTHLYQGNWLLAYDAVKDARSARPTPSSELPPEARLASHAKCLAQSHAASKDRSSLAAVEQHWVVTSEPRKPGEKIKHKWACRHEDLTHLETAEPQRLHDLYSSEALDKAMGRLKKGCAHDVHGWTSELLDQLTIYSWRVLVSP